VTLAAGFRLGPYEVVSLLGVGGVGEVYRARDPRLGRDVAVKVLPSHLSSDPDSLSRFEREARAAAALSHPNILSIFDFGREGDVTYSVTELLEGVVGRAISSWIIHLNVDPRLDPIRDRPEFRALTARVGLPSGKW
jgi:serine/threonine protein kinase